MTIAQIIGPDLLIVIIVGVVLLFGGAAIPKFARNLGKSKSEFEKALKHNDTPPTTYLPHESSPKPPDE